MSLSRREFMHTSAGSVATLSLGAAALSNVALGRAASTAPSARSSQGGLKVLILGGTGFLGPATVDAAKARGHTLTLFNRGKTEKRKGGLYPDIEKIYGNRDPDRRSDESKDAKGEWVIASPDDKGVPRGLEALKGHTWDVVIDNSGYFPRHVKASADLLAGLAKHYVFVSTVSVYSKNDQANADESAELGTLADPKVESMGAQFENYGPLKVLCENAVRDAFKERCSIVRPGYIVGPNDETDRYTYWPARFAKGGEVLMPGGPTDPTQIIDVRDLGEWLVALGESRTPGTFNAVGPGSKPALQSEIAESCRKAGGSDAKATFVPWDFLEKIQKSGDGMPILLPYGGETLGFHTRSNAAAVKAGLKFRTLEDTAAATLAWFKAQTPERQERLWKNPGIIKPEREAEILAAWRAEPKTESKPADAKPEEKK